MKRLVLLLACLAEPVCHLLGIPHPEGLAPLAMSYFNEDI